MLRAIKNFWHRPVIRSGLAHDPRGRFRDPRFVSFIAQTNRRTVDTHVQDAVLRGRALLKQGLLLLVAVGAVWFVVESARAISVF